MSPNRAAVQATLHCLTGCAIGEVLGMVLATALGLGNAASIALVGFRVGFRRALGVALASDTVSITTMELVDNAFILVVPGALAAGLGVPVNRRPIGRGRGHASLHELHGH